MARIRVFKRNTPCGDIRFNVTAMIDCTFIMIVFFILTSQFASQSLEKVSLHKPVSSQALEWDPAKVNRVIVNIPSMADDDDVRGTSPLAGQARGYFIDAQRFDTGNVDVLVQELKLRQGQCKDKEFFVEVRADQRVSYVDVEPVIQAVAAAGISKVNMTALLATDRTN